ncbi:MAG: hypothetical protein WC988_00020 [Patescibacteria group bacterium]
MIIKIFSYIRHKYILIILLLGFLPFTWFKSGYLLRSEEVGYLDYTNLFSKYPYAWSEHSSNGAPTSYSNHLAIFPIGLMYRLFDIVGLSPLAAQYIVIILYFQLTLISSYLLVRHITKNSLAALYASIFYGFTFYNLSTFFYTSKMIQTVIIPPLFYIFYEYLVTRKTRYIFYNFLLFLVCMGLFANPANGVLTLLVYPICFFYYLIGQKGLGKLDTLLRALRFFLPIIPIIAYIFLVYYYSVLAPGLYEAIRENNAFASSFLHTQISALIQNFKGAWWESQEVYNPWTSLLSNRFSILSSMLLTFILFIGYYTIKESLELKRYIYWLFLVLIFIFMAKGSSEPLSFIYPVLFKYIPGFFMFRESWAKFSPVLIFCATLAFSFSIASLLRLRYGKVFSERVLPIFLLINAVPFFVGGPFSSLDANYRSNLDVKIPNYWEEARAWSRNNKEANVLPLPLMYEDQEYYDWYVGRGGDFVGYLPPTLLFSNSIGVRDSGFPTHSRLFRFYNPKLLALLNVDYVLNQKDVINGGLGSLYTVQSLVKDGVINSKPNISFGRLDLYKVTPQYYLPRIFAAGSIWNYTGDVGMTTPASSLPYFSKDNTSVLALNRINGDGLDNNEIIVPDRIKSVKRDFNTWSNGWAWPVVASTDPSSWTYKLVRLKEQFVIALTIDPRQKVDVKLWLAGKRAAEISAFDLAHDIREGVSEDYITAIANVFQSIEGIDSSKRDVTFWSLVGKTIMYVKRSNQALQMSGMSEDSLAKISDEYNKFILWVEDAANPTCTDYCFNVTAPKSGTYDLLLSRSGFNGVSADEISVELYDYIEKKKLNAIDYTDAWFKIESLKLDAGKKYKIGLVLPDMPNIVSSGKWLIDAYSDNVSSLKMEPQASIPRSVIGVKATEKDNISEDRFYISDSSVFHKELHGWLPERNYEISFDYYTENGKLGVATVEDVLDLEKSSLHQNNPEYIPTEKKLTYRREIESVCDKYRYLLGECKNHFSDRITSNFHSTGAYIYIYGYGVGEDKFPEILIDNLAVKEVRNPISFLKYGEAYNMKPPSIKFARLSPTKYKVIVADSDNSYDLIFNQNFNFGWRLYREDSANYASSNNILLKLIYEYLPLTGGKSFIDQHYLANGYANAWVVPKKFSNSTLVIEYWPQRYFYLVSLLVLIIVVFSAGYILIKFIRIVYKYVRQKYGK